MTDTSAISWRWGDDGQACLLTQLQLQNQDGAQAVCLCAPCLCAPRLGHSLPLGELPSECLREAHSASSSHTVRADLSRLPPLFRDRNVHHHHLSGNEAGEPLIPDSPFFVSGTSGLR